MDELAEDTDPAGDRVPEDVITAVREMSNWVGKLTATHVKRASADSPAGQDLSAVAHDTVRETRIRRGIVLSGMRLYSGRSCLDALVICQSLPDPVAPTHTLARAVFESAAWSRWLCDRKLTAEQRVARVAADELHGRSEMDKMVGEMDTAMTSRADLAAEFATAGITPANRPGYTEAVGQVLGGPISAALRLTYRMLSAHPHASSHTVLSSARQFRGVTTPFSHAAVIHLWAFHEFASYIGWEGLNEWTVWADNIKPTLTTAD